MHAEWIREALAFLVIREIARRDERRITMANKIAQFPLVRELDAFEFEFHAQSSFDPRLSASWRRAAGSRMAIRPCCWGRPRLILGPKPRRVAEYRLTEILTVWLAQDRQRFGGNQQLNASCGTGNACDEAGCFEGHHHLVDRGRGDLEMASHIRFGRGLFEDPTIGIDESQILALKLREARSFV
jgi:hypothetical protein